MLCACGHKTYTPVLNSHYNLNAQYKTGDFSYKCKIIVGESFVSVTPLETNAKGMTIKYDGANVSFIRGEMKKEFPRKEIDSVNPAVVIYEVFSVLRNSPDINARVKETEFRYVGTVSAGAFTFVQSRSDKLKSISISDAQLEILFE